MKKLLSLLALAVLTPGIFAAENIYRGNSRDDKDLVCCYMGGRFYADAARKQQLYHHPGNMVCKEGSANAKNAIYRLMGGKIYKGYSVNKDDCIATVFETKTSKGDTLEAKIYKGFVVVRNVETSYDKETKSDTVTSFKVTSDGINEIKPEVLFTVANNKIYRGDSTDDKDCLLTYTGKFSAGRLLFMAVELTR